MRAIDLRSDTVTLPSPAMREAMYRAEVGDDGYGEDPTVARLQDMAAERSGKEASLFVPSGCMANLIAVLTFCHRRGEVVLGRDTDMYLWENGAMSALGGVHPWTVSNKPDGTLSLEDIEGAIRPKDEHYPTTQMIALENTHCQSGGVPLTPQYMALVRAVADRHHLPVYVDGARIFNAAVALGEPVAALARDSDALMFCLSKSLACPVGSMLCGSRTFIEEARHNRKMLGGQMRQAGVIAAAGIVALRDMVDRLAEDHATARILASGLRDTGGLDVKPARSQVHTNMVFFRPMGGRLSLEEAGERVWSAGVKVLPMNGWLRAVTHYGIEQEDVREALVRIRRGLEMA